MHDTEYKEGPLDYARMISLALSGRQEGYDRLYQDTYKEKYFIARKYMGNDADASDVLQDAYVQAFLKLDTLREPDKFSGWLGRIVANTAKNALKKKKMLLFSDLEKENDEGEMVELSLEDTGTERQPEAAYTEKETQEMVHAMIDSLPAEQRMCILMFHLQEMSIREIAEMMECSENTVKSRLNYGRRGIKEQAEQLQKKGYKLYSMPPASLLLFLLHNEETMFIGTENIVIPPIDTILEQLDAMHSGVTAGTSFFKTVAGKVTMAVAGVAVLGGLGIGIFLHARNHPQTRIVQKEKVDQTAAPTATATPGATTAPTATAAPTATPAPTPVPVEDQWKKAYKKQLGKKLKIKNYTYDGKTGHVGDYYYTLHDMNQDDIPELIVTCMGIGDGTGRYGMMYRIYSYSESKGIYEVGEIGGLSVLNGIYYRGGKKGVIIESGADSFAGMEPTYEGCLITCTMKGNRLTQKKKNYTCRIDEDRRDYWPPKMKQISMKTKRTNLSCLNKTYKKYKK